MTVERPPMPTEERKPAWRVACLAYRAKRRAGPATRKRTRLRSRPCRLCGHCRGKEASAEAVNAVAYATRYHSEWFWRGAQHEGKPRVRPEPAG